MARYVASIRCEAVVKAALVADIRKPFKRPRYDDNWRSRYALCPPAAAAAASADNPPITRRASHLRLRHLIRHRRKKLGDVFSRAGGPPLMAGYWLTLRAVTQLIGALCERPIMYNDRILHPLSTLCWFQWRQIFICQACNLPALHQCS